VYQKQVDQRITLMLIFQKTTAMKNYVRGKANPLQAWTGPEGSRSLRLPDFKTIGT
jgi:hypothetical protein